MKVALDISPLKTGHKVRGIGSYTQQLVEEFKKGDYGIDFEFFDSQNFSSSSDLIHYPYFDLFFHTLPIKKAKPRIVTIHDVIPLVFPKFFPIGIKGALNLFLQKRALAKVDAVICDSETSKKDIISKLSFPGEKIRVVYLAPGPNFKKINTSQLFKIKNKYSLPEKFVLYVGDV